MSMFAPWKLTWISSEPAVLLVFDWLSTLVPAAPFSRAGSASASAVTDGVDAGTARFWFDRGRSVGHGGTVGRRGFSSGFLLRARLSVLRRSRRRQEAGEQQADWT